MKKILAGAILALAAVGGTALGGQTQSTPVYIANNEAEGSLGDARSSSNNVEAIGCQVIAWAGSSEGYAYCFARDSNGEQLACDTTDPHQVTAAQALGPTAFVKFVAGKDGRCTLLWAINMSYYAPPVP